MDVRACGIHTIAVSPLPRLAWIVAKRIEAKRGRPRDTHREKDQRDRPLPTNRERHWQSFARTTFWPMSHLLYRRSQRPSTKDDVVTPVTDRTRKSSLVSLPFPSFPFPSQIGRDIRSVDRGCFRKQTILRYRANFEPTCSSRWRRNCDVYSASVFSSYYQGGPLSSLIEHDFLIILLQNNFSQLVSTRENGMKFEWGGVKDKIFVQSFFLLNILGRWFYTYTYIRLIKTSRFDSAYFPLPFFEKELPN